MKIHLQGELTEPFRKLCAVGGVLWPPQRSPCPIVDTGCRRPLPATGEALLRLSMSPPKTQQTPATCSSCSERGRYAFALNFVQYPQVRCSFCSRSGTAQTSTKCFFVCVKPSLVNGRCFYFLYFIDFLLQFTQYLSNRNSDIVDTVSSSSTLASQWLFSEACR